MACSLSSFPTEQGPSAGTTHLAEKSEDTGWPAASEAFPQDGALSRDATKLKSLKGLDGLQPIEPSHRTGAFCRDDPPS